MPTSLSFLQPELSSMELVRSDGSSNAVNQDMLRIGASEICEIQLAHGPLLHSVIHNQAGIVWIEADADAPEVLVNGRSCRRMALRDGDVINAGGLEMTLRYRGSLTPEVNPAERDDVGHMSAEELCDRIVEEQTEIKRYESARRQGWQHLMSAIKAVHESDSPEAGLPVVTQTDDPDEECERLLDQIREMSEMMNGRSIELDDCEAELVAATALLHETQDRMARQIEDLLGQFSELPHSGEMRASA